MSNMTAAFRLDFTVGSLDQVQGAKGVLSELVQSLKELAQSINPFAEMMEPVAAAKAATSELNETLNATGAAAQEAAAGVETATAAVTGLDEALRVTGSAAAEVGTGLHRLDGISGIFEQGAWAVNDLNVVLRGLVQAETAAGSGMRAIGADAEAAAAQSVSAIERIRAAASFAGMAGMGYGRNVGGAVRGFGGAIEEGVGRAFGAAATGFGLVMPVKAAAEYDNDLTHIGIGLNLHGQANVDFASAEGRRLDMLARQTGQRSEELAAAEAFLGREGYTGARLRNVMPDIATIGTAYNARPDAVARTAFSMQQNIGIKDPDLRGALASASVAGKLADMPMEELAPLFPELAAAAGGMKVHGRQGLDDILAALAVSRKSAGSLGQAVSNERQFIEATTSNAGVKNFAKLGIDIRKYRAAAIHKGIDPFEATLQAVNVLTHGGQNEEAMATLFHNVMDKTFATAMMAHITGDPAHGEWGYLDIKKRLGEATPKDVTKDFDTGIKSTKIVLDAFEGSLSQLERRIGHGFVPILKVATAALHGLIGMFDWLDQHIPGATSAIVGTTGGMLALATAMGAIGAIAGPLKAGFALFRVALAPIAGLLGGVSLATAGVVIGVAALVAGVVAAALYVSRNLTRIGQAFDAGGKGITGALKGTWNVAKMVFNDFTHWLDGWGGGLGTKLHALVAGIGRILAAPLAGMFHWAMDEFHALDNAFASSWIGRHMGMGGMPPAPAVAGGGSASSIHLHVSTDDGVKVRQKPGTRASNVTLHQNNGRMIAQP